MGRTLAAKASAAFWFGGALREAIARDCDAHHGGVAPVGVASGGLHILSSRSQNVPIVLDDALVFSDDDRIQRMFDALSRAGRQQQVIVLTCRTKAFEQLGGRSLRIEEAD
jgi:hypothetical protein